MGRVLAWASYLLLAGAVLLLPWLNERFRWEILEGVILVQIYALLALGLNVVVGFAGLLHLGYTTFFAVGAFAFAYLTSIQSPLPEGWIMGFWPALILSVLFTSLVGFILGAPTLRLRGDYLAIVTLGFVVMFEQVMVNYDVTKAKDGLAGVAGMNLFGRDLTGNSTAWYFVLLAILVATVFFMVRLRDSRIGRALKAMREDEIAARSCGINLTRLKVFSFVVSAAVAGLAGSLYGSYFSFVSLGFPFEFNGSIMILAMVILGGVGSVRGALVGGLALGLVNQVLAPKLITLSSQMGLGVDLSKAQFLIFGLTLVLMMLLRPEGLLPEQAARIELHRQEDPRRSKGRPARSL